MPYHTMTFCRRFSRENPVDKPLQKAKVHTTNCFIHTQMQRAQARVYQHKYWKMLARRRKQWCQGITAAPQPGFAHYLSSGTICDSIFWWSCTAHLEGLSHKQQCSSKTREPDFPDGHQEGRLCTCGRRSLTTPFEIRMLYGPRSVSVGKPDRADIYTSSLVWNDLPVALPEQQRHVYLQLGVILKFRL